MYDELEHTRMNLKSLTEAIYFNNIKSVNYDTLIQF